MIPQSAWVVPIVVTWTLEDTDPKTVNNEILYVAMVWVENIGLSIAVGPSGRSPKQNRIELKLIVEKPDVEESYVLPEQVAIDFLSFLKSQALSRGWNLVGSYRRFTEEEGLPIPYLQE